MILSQTFSYKRLSTYIFVTWYVRCFINIIVDRLFSFDIIIIKLDYYWILLWTKQGDHCPRMVWQFSLENLTGYQAENFSSPIDWIFWCHALDSSVDSILIWVFQFRILGNDKWVRPKMKKNMHIKSYFFTKIMLLYSATTIYLVYATWFLVSGGFLRCSVSFWIKLFFAKSNKNIYN